MPRLRRCQLAAFAAVFVYTLAAFLAAGVIQAGAAGGTPPSLLAGPLPPSAAVRFAMCCCSVLSALSLLAQACLADDADARVVAWLGTALMAAVALLFGLTAAGALATSHYAYLSALSYCGVLMWFLLMAVAARGSLVWLAGQAAVFVVVTLVVTSATGWQTPTISVGFALITASGWRAGVQYPYAVANALLRWGALTAVQRQWAASARERWYFRVLIATHVGGALAILAIQPTSAAYGAGAGALLDGMITQYLHGITPLLVVHLIALSRARTRALLLRVDDAEARRAAAEAAASRQASFLRYAMHEVRVPFNAVTLGLEALASHGAVAAAADALADVRTIQVAAAAMATVLNDTLDAERIKSGLFRLEMSVLAPRDVLARVLHTLSPCAAHAHVALSLVVAHDVPAAVHADGTRLAQVVANYASNAIKFAPHDGTGQVEVRLLVLLPPAAAAAATTATVAAATATATTAAATTITVDAATGDAPPAELPAHASVHSASATTGRTPPHVGTSAALLSLSTCAVTLDRALLLAGGMLRQRLAPRAWPPALLPDGASGASTPRDAHAIDASQPHATTAANPTATAAAAAPLWLRLEVSDNGAGISATDQPRLFQEFQQAPGGASAGGSGLGLYICRAIMEQHGGRVGVASAPGAGATFWAEFPVVPAPAAASALTPPAFSASGALSRVPTLESVPFTVAASGSEWSTMIRGAPAGAGARASPVPLTAARPPLPPRPPPSPPAWESDDITLAVASPSPSALPGAVSGAVAPPFRVTARRPHAVLVVDDDATTRLFLSRGLSRLLAADGAVVATAEDGVDALAQVVAAADATPFTAVCVDKEMPRLDGTRTIERLRAIGFTGLVVAITGAGGAAPDADALRAAGADTVLCKPVSVARVAQLIRDAAGRRAPVLAPSRSDDLRNG